MIFVRHYLQEGNLASALAKHSAEWIKIARAFVALIPMLDKSARIKQVGIKGFFALLHHRCVVTLRMASIQVKSDLEIACRIPVTSAFRFKSAVSFACHSLQQFASDSSVDWRVERCPVMLVGGNVVVCAAHPNQASVTVPDRPRPIVSL